MHMPPYAVYDELVFNVYRKRPSRPYEKNCNTIYKRMRLWYDGKIEDEANDDVDEGGGLVNEET